MPLASASASATRVTSSPSTRLSASSSSSFANASGTFSLRRFLGALPLIEGTTVATKYGPIKTDHILFIASGAFHVAKPADLLPELQGRLPIRVELQALTEADFIRILSDTRASLTEQYRALLKTEAVTVEFADDGIAALARIAAEVNEALENIGARRLQTVMEKLLEEVSFTAEERGGETVVVDAAFVEAQLAGIARDTDLSRYIL